MAVNKGLAGIGCSILAVLLVGVLSLGVFGCAKPTAPQALISEPSEQTTNRLSGQLEEVSPPEVLQTLKQIIDAYDPQVRILSPRPNEVVDSTTVSVRFQVRGLPLFKDQQWGLGPHLHVFLDDEPYRAVYDLSEPLVLPDLAPGTLTLRVFASRPWHESFKNQGAFDQRTFHVFAQTPQKALDKNQPLLTYSRPQGTYGAEPIMLDFYLTNAPLHMIAQEDSRDEVGDWRIRCTINGQSFVFDQWQPVYLKGFKSGQNWIQLELIDENGNLIENVFNNAVRVITYEPGGEDALSKLVRGDLTLQEVAGIIDPTYVPPVQEVPEPETASPDSFTLREEEPLVEPLEPNQSGAEQVPAIQLPVEVQPKTQPLSEKGETTPTLEEEKPAQEQADDLEGATQSPAIAEDQNESEGTPIAPDEVLIRDRTLEQQTQTADQEPLEQDGEGTNEPNQLTNSVVVPAQPSQTNQENDVKPNVDALKDAVESLDDSVNSLNETITDEVSETGEDALKGTSPEGTVQDRGLESAAEDLKSAADDLESALDDLEPSSEVPATPIPPSLQKLPAPPPNRFFRQFQQWRQQYQESKAPNETAPSLDGQPSPIEDPVPELSDEVAPSSIEEGTEPIELPDIDVPAPQDSETNSPTSSAPDSLKSEVSADR
ncbi:MAG TPA: hypothetical protein V6D29_07335, partial [Leptolyngbyaceae cyanobacterium]